MEKLESFCFDGLDFIWWSYFIEFLNELLVEKILIIKLGIVVNSLIVVEYLFVNC